MGGLRHIRRGGLLLSLTLVALLLPTTAAPAAGKLTTVVVVGQGSSADAARAVVGHSGTVRQHIALVDGVVARVPANEISDLSADALVESVTRNYKLNVQSSSFAGDLQTTYPQSVGAMDLWRNDVTGKGVGVALLDTGVSDHPDVADRVAASADLTTEGTFSDSYGHGTSMAGIIAGDGSASQHRYIGIAPRAHLVSVKVAGADGSTTLGQVLYGLQLIDASKSRYNIRVVLMALAGPATSGPDPLVLAVERLWADGLVVVTAAGNSGPGPGSVASPGVDPYVLTVGATDESGTPGTGDDSVAEFSARGPSVFGLQKPDFVAPGMSIVSLRAPGSTIDATYPNARIEDDYFRGSGTSMAAAVAAGAAALLLQVEPSLTPDAVKGKLLGSAAPVAGADVNSAGAGTLDVAAALRSAAPPANADLPALHGSSSLLYPSDPTPGHGKGSGRSSWDWYPSPVGGDRWLGRGWANKAWNGTEWVGRGWAGRGWAGSDWSGRGWADSDWAGRGWAGRGWAGELWSDSDWSGRGWAGRGWAADNWAAEEWR
jgi:serine protease AprX